MNPAKKIIKSYLKDVSSLLLCDKKEKRAILNELKSDAEEYASDREEVTRTELENILGSPENIAGSASVNADTAYLKKRLAIKRVILIALLAALVIWAIFTIISLIDVHTEAHGYFEEGLLAVQNSIRRVLAL